MWDRSPDVDRSPDMGSEPSRLGLSFESRGLPSSVCLDVTGHLGASLKWGRWAHLSGNWERPSEELLNLRRDAWVPCHEGARASKFKRLIPALPTPESVSCAVALRLWLSFP